MGMERVTVEQNGERFTLEVPEGTSDEEITNFLTSQQSTSTPEAIKPSENTYNPGPETVGGIDVGEATRYGLTAIGNAANNPNVQAQMMNQARPIAQTYWSGPAEGGIRDMANVAKNVSNASPEGVAEMLKNPMLAAKAYLQGHPWAGASIGETLGKAPGAVARGALSLGANMITAPENAITLPYNMAAYEQEKIRQNPNAPGLESNPYAQVVRGETKTQGRAGEANRMKALASMPFGGVTPEERQILEEDMRMKSAIRKKAFEKVMGPVAPGSF